MIPQRVSLITLGVADLSRAQRFYEAWGWTRAEESQPAIAFYQLAGLVLALYPRERLAADQGRGDLPSGSGAATLAINFSDEAAVDAAWAEATGAGAQPLRAPERMEYGGYVGYLADPDGHVWELAHVAAFLPAADGTLTLPSLVRGRDMP